MKEEAVLAQSKKPSADDGNTDLSLERTAGLVSSEPAVPQAAFARTILLSPSTALTRLLICLMAAFLYVKSQ